MVFLRSQIMSDWLQLLTLVLVSFSNMGNLWNSAEARFIKNSHVPLVSSLSTRRHFGSTTTGGTNVPKDMLGVGVDATSSGPGTSINSGTVAVSPPYNTAEVIGPKTSNLNTQEPTCEELRAMWIFSKRQSRAAEITNEIPTYRDPFGFKIWKPYYSVTRNILGSVRMIPWIGEKSLSPVFGRVISRAPIVQPRVFGHRGRHSVADSTSSPPRIYGAEEKSTFNYHGGFGSRNINAFRRPSQHRYIGTNSSTADEGNSNLVKVQGSFQRLKELIWTERAKELTQQRKAEELAARAAVLKEIANGQSIQSPYKHSLKLESSFSDENRSPDRNVDQHLKAGGRLIAKGPSHYIKGNGNKSSNNNNAKNKIDNYDIQSNYRSNRKVKNSSTHNNRDNIFSKFGGIIRTSDHGTYVYENANLKRNHKLS